MSSRAYKRIQLEIRDIVNLLKKNPEALDGMHYYCDESNILEGYALIRGPMDTSYYNGFYIIKFSFPDAYPYEPPACSHISVCDKRQSPNFHDCGTVCLSRLNTWSGREKDEDKWVSTMGITSIMDMIQGQVLTPLALDNEPNYDHSIVKPLNALKYEEVVRYCNYNYNLVKIYTKLKYNETSVPVEISQQMAATIYKYVVEHRQQYIDEFEALISKHDGVYYNCSTYSNSHCYAEYKDTYDLFNKVFGFIEKIKIKMKVIDKSNVK